VSCLTQQRVSLCPFCLELLSCSITTPTRLNAHSTPPALQLACLPITSSVSRLATQTKACANEGGSLKNMQSFAEQMPSHDSLYENKLQGHRHGYSCLHTSQAQEGGLCLKVLVASLQVNTGSSGSWLSWSHMLMLASWPISKFITPSPAASASLVAFSPSLSDSNSFDLPPTDLMQRAHTFSSWLDSLHVHTTILVQPTQRVSCRAFRREPCTIT